MHHGSLKSLRPLTSLALLLLCMLQGILALRWPFQSRNKRKTHHSIDPLETHNAVGSSDLITTLPLHKFWPHFYFWVLGHGKFPNVPEPQFPPLQNGNNISTRTDIKTMRQHTNIVATLSSRVFEKVGFLPRVVLGKHGGRQKESQQSISLRVPSIHPLCWTCVCHIPHLVSNRAQTSRQTMSPCIFQSLLVCRSHAFIPIVIFIEGCIEERLLNSEHQEFKAPALVVLAVHMQRTRSLEIWKV